MAKSYEGLPAAEQEVEQSTILAQLHILRHLAATRAGIAGSVLPRLEPLPR